MANRNIEDILKSGPVVATIARTSKRLNPGGETAEAEAQAVAAETKTARQLLLGMRTRINPIIARLMLDGVAHGAVLLSFPKFKHSSIEGLEEAVKAMSKGKAFVVSTHASYLDIAGLPYLLRKAGVRGVYYLGGENLAEVKPDEVNLESSAKSKSRLMRGLFARMVKPSFKALTGYLLRNTGMIYLKRGDALFKNGQEHRRENAVLFANVLNAYLNRLFEEGHVVVNFAGRGRYKTGEIEPFDSVYSSTAALRSAECAIPVSVTYETIPEDTKFAAAMCGEKKSGASWLLAFKLINWRKITQWADEGYGTFYATFGKPMQMSDYVAAPSRASLTERELKKNVGRFQRDISDTLVRNMVLTPKSALSVALLSQAAPPENTTNPYSIIQADICGLISSATAIVEDAKRKGLKIAPALRGDSCRLELLRAFAYMAKKGALQQSSEGTFSITDVRLPVLYANSILQTLNRASEQQYSPSVSLLIETVTGRKQKAE
ncbi:hypothetical protein HYU17_01900 [Candidatus Woesearchaeota archaeon]|nr:hypothetical protein [Candidatus Woesearchaeota archaeon]